MMLRLPRTASVAAGMVLAGWLASAQSVPQTPSPATAHPRPPGAPLSPYDLKYPALHSVELPKVATFTLSNGMKLFLLEDHDLPVISGSARIRTGNLFDPADKVGLATMTGMVMRTGGTREMTGEQLDRKLEDVAGSVESSIGESAGEVSFFSLTENVADVLGAFHDVLTAPAFRMYQVDVAKSQLRGNVARRNADAGGVLAREFSNILYGNDTPYGWNVEYETLDRITRADLQAFHKRYFFPKNVMLAVWGDFDTAKMKDQLEQLFAGWTVDQPPVPAFPKVREKAAPGVYLAKEKDATQTLFALGYLSGTSNDKDYPALTIMADILGGGFSSRLYRQVHSRLGSGFTVSAEWAAGFDHPGIFKISGGTQSFSTVAAIKVIQEEIGHIREAQVTEDELRIARDFALSRLVFAVDTPKKMVDRVLTYEYFGYPADSLVEYQKAVAAVTRADVLRVAKQYLRPADLTILVVGNPEDFSPSLDTLGGSVREIDLKTPEPKEHTASTDAASLEQGKRILTRLQQAVGGVEKIASVKDYSVVRDVRMVAAAGGVNATESELWMAPGNIREDGESPSGKTSIYSDGRSGWLARGRNSTALVGIALKGVQGDLFRSYFSLLLSDRVSGRTVSALTEDTIEISSPDGELVQITVSPETGLPEQVSYVLPAPSGPPMLVQETITQFGNVDGMKVPYQFETRRNGNLFAQSSVKDFKVNSGLVLTDLERRP